MSESQDDQPPKKAPSPYVPGQPLPRLWKAEPDPDDESEGPIELADAPTTTTKKTKAAPEAASGGGASASGSKPRAAASKPAKPKKKKTDDGAPGEKRVLLEETPAFDTIETRQRARMLVGGLMIFCVGILVWLVYGMIFGGSDRLADDAGEMPASAMNPLPVQAQSREPEARYMLDLAREYAKKKQAATAITMLKRIVSVYRGTAAAGEAQAALDRPRQNLPLFPEGPFVAATKSAEVATPPGTNSQPPAQAAIAGVPAAGTPPGLIPSAPPPQVAGAGTGTMPPAGHPHPGAAGPPPGGASAATNPSMGPDIASRTAPGGPGTVPSMPSPPAGPTTGPGAGGSGGAAAVPPGPGEVATLIPATGGHAPAPSPAGGNPAANAADRGTGLAGRPARSLPPGFRARPEAGVHESGWPMVIVGERDRAIMVLVHGETFTMGNDRGQAAAAPAHTVQLSTYYIDQHEVTNRQFRTFLDETRYRGQPPGKWLTDPKMKAMPDDAPAVFVSYQDAEEYAIWALKRLPTEAQWEMAARSLDGRRSPWGDEAPRWSRPRNFQQIDRVMSFSEDVSPFGVHDMAGNALEWVRDWYDPAYYARLRDKTTLDPTGPPTRRQGILRVVRGGSKDWLMFWRQGLESDSRRPYVGFRCSLAVEGGEASAVIAPRPVNPPGAQPGQPPPGQPSGNDVPF